MKKLILLFVGLLLLFFCVNTYAQYIPTTEDLLIEDVIKDFEEDLDNLIPQRGGAFDFYNNLRTWIPYCNSDPLKNPPITYIEVSFHVFLDNNGGNNNYTNTQEGKEKLLYVLNLVNLIYSGQWVPSDPVSGVIPLPNNDTRIRFTLGDNNERIFFYNNTTLNHKGGNDVTPFYNYVQINFPSRATKLNVFFTAGYYGGRVTQNNIQITNGGSGYISLPTITFTPSGATGTAVIQNGSLVGINITNGGFYNDFAPPQITISGGSGTGATAIVTKLEGGATGYANMPSPTNLSRNHYVVMLHCHESNDWIYGMLLAHEFAHNLDLKHTYCGGGASAVICNNHCSINCSVNSAPCNDDEYLSDIFGTCPGTYPHIAIWANPDDPTIPNAEKITNNVVGGSMSQLYISPMQAGQMHRTLALKSTRKYVKEDCYSQIPLTITTNEEWNFNLKLYRDVVVSSGVVLTISGVFEQPSNGKIIVDQGATLLVTGTLNLGANNIITIQPGGKLIVDGGKITNACPDKVWYGIFLSGNINLPQTAQNQGTIELKN
ncbi:MAG: hypothetical protein FWC41_04275, partial [Firmicutes bacterium]|nr:hypothetical protein [Bacillota bacterium]